MQFVVTVQKKVSMQLFKVFWRWQHLKFNLFFFYLIFFNHWKFYRIHNILRFKWLVEILTFTPKVWSLFGYSGLIHFSQCFFLHLLTSVFSFSFFVYVLSFYHFLCYLIFAVLIRGLYLKLSACLSYFLSIFLVFYFWLWTTNFCNTLLFEA